MLQQRQLAAIMFTDIVGYTDMMQKNEELAVKVIKHHRSVLEKNVADHKGDVWGKSLWKDISHRRNAKRLYNRCSQKIL